MKRGFTVFEFLIILGVSAFIAAAFILLLKPAERLREMRDRQRIADLAELKKITALYLASAAKPDLDSRGECIDEYKSTDGSTATDGTGWLPINFSEIPGGSVLKNLPIDVINDQTHFYSYRCDEKDLTFQFDARMESKRYQKNVP